MISSVDADNADANGIASCTAKLSDLLHKITNDPIDLLDHRLGQDFHFGANLNGGNRAASYDKTGRTNASFVRDDFAEGAIASSCFDPWSLLLTFTTL